MARRRFARVRAASRRSVAFVRKSYRARGSSRSGSNPLMNIVLPAFAYGAVRAPIKNTIMPYVPNVLGDNTDEAVMGVAGYLLMKNTTGFMHDFGKAALYVESASLGNNIVSPMISAAVGGTSTATTGQSVGAW